MTVALETSLQSLRARLGDLQAVLSDLTPFITDVRVPVPLVDDLDDVVTDLAGAAEEAAAAVDDALQASRPDGALAPVSSAVGRAHTALNRCQAAYVGLFVPEIPGDDSLVEKLLERGQRYGRQWLDWSQVVRRSIALCAVALKASAHAMTECWQELALRLSRHSVSVQATSIAQQITTRDGQRENTNDANAFERA
jgi:hypothetical protein